MARRLLLLNGLAAIAAVLNHASGWGFTSLFWWTPRYLPVTAPDFSQAGSASYYLLRVLEQAIMFGPPAFLFVSGFFVAFAARGGRGTLSGHLIGNRIKMLVIPYALWSLAIFAGRGLEGIADTPAGYAEKLLLGQACEPYYYIPVLTQLYLLAPVIVRLVRDHWKPVLIGAALIQAVVQAARYPVLLGLDVPAATWIVEHSPGWFFPHMLFWFVLGTFAGIHLDRLKAWVATWGWLFPWATLGLAALTLLEWELLLRWSGRPWLPAMATLLDSVYNLAFVLAFVSLAQNGLTSSRWLNAVGERSFGIYLIHAPVLEIVSRASYHAAPLLLAYQVPFLILLITTGLAVPLSLMWLVSRSSARPYYNYMFG